MGTELEWRKVERACNGSRLLLSSSSDYWQVYELERTRRPVFVSTDIGFLIGARVLVDVIRHTCLHALVDGVDVRPSVIVTIVRVNEVRVPPNVVRGINRSIASPICVICPYSISSQCGFERNRSVEMHVNAHRVVAMILLLSVVSLYSPKNPAYSPFY